MAPTKRPASRAPSAARKCMAEQNGGDGILIAHSSSQSSTTLQSTEVCTPRQETGSTPGCAKPATPNSSPHLDPAPQKTSQTDDFKWFHGRKGVLPVTRHRFDDFVVNFQIQDFDMWTYDAPQDSIAVRIKSVNVLNKLGYYYSSTSWATITLLRTGLERGLQRALDQRYGAGNFNIRSWRGRFENNARVRTWLKDGSLKRKKAYKACLQQAAELTIRATAAMVPRVEATDVDEANDADVDSDTTEGSDADEDSDADMDSDTDDD